MDDKWFKAQQKRANITAEQIAQELGRDRSVVSRIYTGRQPMTAEQAKVFARVLEVPLAEVLKRGGVLSVDEAQQVSPGFAESDVVRSLQIGASSEQTGGIVRAMGGDRTGVECWEVKSTALSLGGYLPGDFLLVDTYMSENVKAGDTVIAQRYDWQKGAAVTLLRRFEPPVLVAANTNPEDLRVHVVDGNNVVIMGKIIASWRRQ